MEWLEDADVKDIMDAGSIRQAEGICDIVDAFQDLVRPSISRPELATCAREEALHRSM